MNEMLKNLTETNTQDKITNDYKQTRYQEADSSNLMHGQDFFLCSHTKRLLTDISNK